MWEMIFNPIELTAVITGVISVIFSWRKNILTYFFGIISVLLYVYLCYQAGIYADMGINIFYFLMSVYGWINWSRLLKQNQDFVPSFLTKLKRIFFFFCTLLFWIILYFILNYFTNSNVAVADSFTTAFFITGMILMALKITENWLYFIIGNVVSVPLYAYKEMYLSSIFFVILTFFAVLGYQSWKAANKKNTP